MLKFDSKGHLIPRSPIPCLVGDLKTYFVDEIKSVTRALNYDNYIRYSNDLKKLLDGAQMKQWINGSFVTKKRTQKI